MRSGGCLYISVSVGAAAAVVGAVTGIKGYINAQEAAEKQENMQLEANAKSGTRAKMQSKVQEQLNARNLKRTQAQVASAVTYERILADRSRRETARTRQNFIESRSTGHSYNRGNPV